MVARQRRPRERGLLCLGANEIRLPIRFMAGNTAVANRLRRACSLFPALPISLRPESRHCQIEHVGVGSRIVVADVRIRQMLIAITDADSLALFAEDLQPAAEVDGVHELRSLRGEHAIDEVDEATVSRKKRLNPALGKERRAEAGG